MKKLFKTLKKFDKKILLSQYLEESESLLSFFNIYNKICNYFLDIYILLLIMVLILRISKNLSKIKI